MSLQSCFISYSHKDEAFAQRLYADLTIAGIDCWYAPEDMPIGGKIRQTIEEAISDKDKLLLILSAYSVDSIWVEQEVEKAFDLEQQSGNLVLFPIMLDDAVRTTSNAWAATIRRMRHIGDFRKWRKSSEYDHSLHRLLRDLT